MKSSPHDPNNGSRYYEPAVGQMDVEEDFGSEITELELAQIRIKELEREVEELKEKASYLEVKNKELLAVAASQVEEVLKMKALAKRILDM
jgi:hypothetical protein